MANRIFFVGFMGAGKSYWGKWLAEATKRPFIDLDDFIEQKSKQSISTIFEIYGEDYFRKLETRYLQQLHDFEGIIATGGGCPCFNNNMDWINKNGHSIFLNPSIETLVHRLLNEREKRPLLAKETPQTLHYAIHQRLKQRLPFYLQARTIIENQEATLLEETLLELI